jgi:hypothetical protein
MSVFNFESDAFNPRTSEPIKFAVRGARPSMPTESSQLPVRVRHWTFGKKSVKRKASNFIGESVGR